MSISIAHRAPVYSVESIAAAMSRLDEDSPPSLMRLYRRMLETGPERFSVKPSRVPDMDQVKADLPNFSKALDSVFRQIALCVDTKDDLEIAPICLVGPPGIGKTRFAKSLAKLLCTGYEFISMNSMTAGWILSGAAPTWHGAKPGKVFDTLVHKEFKNPVVVIDEIDKASGAGQYDPLGALYTLLEKETSRAFVDEFAEIPIDAGRVIWVSTANDLRSIPDPILSRMMVFDVPAPTPEEARVICAAIYREIRQAHAWGLKFPDEPSEDVLDVLAHVAPREVNQVLINAFGGAKMAGREELVAADFPVPESKKRRIGF
jgi:ATP-dependent Lon protease